MALLQSELTQALGQLTGLAEFSGARLEEIAVKPLGGLTNKSWKLTCRGQSYVLRLESAGGGSFIDRKAEFVHAQEAAKAGLAPAVLFQDVAGGVILTRYLEGTAPLTAKRLQEDPSALQRAATSLRALHQSDLVFQRRFDALAIAQSYQAEITARGLSFPFDLVEPQRAIARLTQGAAEPSLVPSHCDLVPDNLLDDGAKVWLIDWEYSGMNDPYWDLAYLSLESELGERRDGLLLSAYHHGKAPSDALQRLYALKPICDWLSALWCCLQAASGNAEADFLALAQARLERLQSNLRKCC